MTHPIPGADSEREELYREAGAFEEYWAAHQECPEHSLTTKNCASATWHARAEIARAAAKVGANVAAEGILVLNEQGNAWPIRWRADGNWEFADNGFGHYPALAAGAPAETPKPVAWIVFAEVEGVWVPQFPARARRSDAEHDASLFGQTTTEVRPLFDAAQPAPIAGDVEKDAAMREAVRDAVAENLRGLYYCGRVWSAWSVGTMGEDDFAPAEEDEDIISNITDAAIAAMLANSSSGEAG